VPLRALDDPKHFKVELATLAQGPAPPPLIARRKLPTPLIRREIVRGPATPNTGAGCEFPKVTARVTFDRDDPRLRMIAEHMYYAIHTRARFEFLKRLGAARSRRPSPCPRR
jgi:hypothetical protein